MIQLFPSILLATVAVPCVFAFAEPTELVYHYPKDELVVYEISDTVDQSQTVEGQTMAVKTTTTERVSTELLVQHRDGSFIIGNTLQGVAFSMAGSGMDFAFDSSNPDDERKLTDPMIASMMALRGIEIRFMIDPTGAILDVPNLPAVQNHIFELEDPSLMAMMEMMVQRDTLISGSEMHYKLLPSGPVDINDQWKSSFEIPFELGGLKLVLDLTLDAINEVDGHQIAEISISGLLSFAAPDAHAVNVKFEVSEVGGSARFDIDDGLFLSTQINTGYKVTIGLEDAAPKDQVVVSINQQVKTTRLDD